MDPVDSVEYEMQLCSPMKRKPNKHRNRKRRKSSKENAENTTEQMLNSTEIGSSCDVSIESASTSGVLGKSAIADQSMNPTTVSNVNTTSSSLSTPSTSEMRVVKNLKLELGDSPTASGSGIGNSGSGSVGRKRKTSESSTSKPKQRRIDMDKIVSPVIPQHTGWKRNNKPSRPPPLRRSRTHAMHASEKIGEKSGACQGTCDTEENTSNTEDGEMNAKKKGEKFRFGNYDRYYGYRNLNEFMDVRLKVFTRHPQFFKDKDVLDIGCNVGLLTIAVAEKLQPKSIVGIDIDKTLINRARSNLSLHVRVPENLSETHDTTNPSTSGPPRKRKRRFSRRFSRSKSTIFRGGAGGGSGGGANNLDKPAEFFPMSMPMCLGPIPTLGKKNEPQIDPQDDERIQFPDNVFFRMENYVPKDETALQTETQQYDLILCLSVSKWIHLNFGDAGIKLAFKRMFNQLRPGGKLILEAQNWPSYKKKKKVSPIVLENYKSIKFFPKKFNEFLLSTEVGFSHSYPLGIPKHLSKGFSRPIQVSHSFFFIQYCLI